MKKTIKIEGMTCEGCVNRIKNVLKNTKGVSNFDVSLENKLATLEVKNDKVLIDVIDKINEIGFKASI